MGKVVNPNFFNKSAQKQQAEEPVASLRENTGEEKAGVSQPEPQKSSAETPVATNPSAPIEINPSILVDLKTLSAKFKSFGRKRAAIDIENIYSRGVRNRFSVAVVGEFSRGKSTFINNLLEKEILPVGDLPTTALLTRIRHNSQEKMIHFNRKNQKVADLPLSEESWEGLVAENFGKCDPTGTVLVGIDNPWLKNNCIEIMDTPGAGDLEEKRAQVIGDALLGSDGAIITITATSALSMSEKLFIEQRLLSRKTPFLMLIVTKLDLVRKSERDTVIGYIMDKLASWNMDIPVFIPNVVETASNRYVHIMGMDKIKNHILSWINHPERVKLTEQWILSQITAVLQRELDSLSEQSALLCADGAKREELINEKKDKLSQAELVWEDLRLQMLERANKCFNKMDTKAQEQSVTITERLQYEASHTNNPQKWWESDFSYRLKVELANMAVSIENLVSRTINDDARWFNAALEKSFKTHVLYSGENISGKDLVTQTYSTEQIMFEDLDKKRNITRIGTAALSVLGFAVFSSIGFLPIVATMGIGTGSSIISEGVFKKKVEAQRDAIKTVIARDVPNIVAESTTESEARIKAVYNDMIRAAVEQETLWKDAQLTAIEESINSQADNAKESIDAQLLFLNEYFEKIAALILSEQG